MRVTRVSLCHLFLCISLALGPFLGSFQVFAQATPVAAPSLTTRSIDGSTIPTSTTPTFTWTAVTGANTYTVEICKVFMTSAACPTTSLAIPAATVTTPTYTPLVELPRNIQLYWHVRANSTLYGSSPWSASQSFISANAPPVAILTAPLYTALQGLTPTLTWKTSVPLKGVFPQSYRLQISTEPTFGSPIFDQVIPRNDSPVGTIISTTTTSTLVQSHVVPSSPTLILQHGTQYYWRVRTLAGLTGSSAASMWAPATNTATTTGSFKTTAPSLPVLTAFSSTAAQTTLTPTFKWTTAVLATSAIPTAWDLQIATNTTFTTGLIDIQNVTAVTDPLSTSTSYIRTYTPTTPLTWGTQYYWRVRSKTTAGSGTATSAWTAASALKTAISSPTLLTPGDQADLSTNRPTFSWTKVNNASSYALQISTTGSSGTYTAIACTQVVNADNTISCTPTADLPIPAVGQSFLYWKIVATPVAGYGAAIASVSRSVTRAVAPPIALVTGPLYSALQSDQPTLTWTTTVPVGGNLPQAYHVQISTDPKFGTIQFEQDNITRSDDGGSTATLLKDSFQIPPGKLSYGGIQYYWRVRTKAGTTTTSDASAWAPATNTATTTGSFKTLSLSTPSLTAQPAIVTSLTPQLKWTTPVTTTVGSPIPTAWDLQIATNTTFTTGLIDIQNVTAVTDPLSTSTSYIRTYTPTTPLTWGTQYYWRVRSKTGSGVTTGYSAWTTAGAFKTSLGVVTNISPTNGFTTESGTPTFTWSSAPGNNVVSYTLQYTTSGNATVGPYVALGTVTAPTTNITGSVALPKPTVGTVLYWRVATNGPTGFTSVYSAPFSLTPATVPPLPVLVGPPAATVQSLTPKLSWKTTVTASGIKPDAYSIQISPDSKFATTVVNTTMTRSDDGGSTSLLLLDSYDIAPGALQPATQYYWRVNGKTSGDSTAWVPTTHTAIALGAFKTSVAPVTIANPPDLTDLVNNRPTITWTKATGASTYALQSSINGGTTWVAVACTQVVNADNTISCTPTADLPIPAVGQPYIFLRVLTTGLTGYGSSTSTTLRLIRAIAPSIPVANLPLTGSQQTTLQPTLRWTTAVPLGAVTPTNWDIQLAKDAAFTTGLSTVTNVPPVTETSTATSYVRSWVVSPALSTATTYYWRVRSKSANNDVSAWSAVLTFKTPLSAPDTALPTLFYTFSASPLTIQVGQTTNLTATITGGTATGNISYEFRCKNTDAYTVLAPTATTTSTFPCGATYTTAGTYYPQVRITRQGTVVESLSTSTPVTVTTAPTPTPTPAPGSGPGTAGPRRVNVLEVRYFPPTSDLATQRAQTNERSTFLQQTLQAGSRPKGYKNATATNFLTVNKVATIERLTSSPNTGNALTALNAMLSANNNELCNIIVANNIDQVWMWKDVPGTNHPGDTGSYNNEFDWVFSSKMYPGQSTLYCNGQRTFMFLGLDQNAEPSNAIHSFGHAMEAFLPWVLGDDLFWTKWVGKQNNLSTPACTDDGSINQYYSRAIICGDAHFPPNGQPVDGCGYDYANRTYFEYSQCENWKVDWSGAETYINCERWGCTQGGYFTWWMQNWPSYNNAQIYQGKKIPNWYDFLVDTDSAIEYYARRHTEWWIDETWLGVANPSIFRPLYIGSVTQKLSPISTSGPTAITTSHPFDTTTNNPFLMVSVSYRTDEFTPGKVTSMTYDGKPLTSLKLADGVTDARQQQQQYATEVWYLPTSANSTILNPTSAKTLTVNFTGPTDSQTITATTYLGINQTTPLRGPAAVSGANPTNYSYPATHSLSIPTGATDIAVSVHSTYSGGPMPVSTTLSPDYTYSSQNINVFQSLTTKTATNTSTSTSWTATNYPWSMIGVALRK